MPRKHENKITRKVQTILGRPEDRWNPPLASFFWPWRLYFDVYWRAGPSSVPLSQTDASLSCSQSSRRSWWRSLPTHHKYHGWEFFFFPLRSLRIIFSWRISFIHSREYAISWKQINVSVSIIFRVVHIKIYSWYTVNSQKWLKSLSVSRGMKLRRQRKG